MTSAVPFSQPRHPDHHTGDAVRAPRELMSGPGRYWNAEPRWRWVQIRIAGRWRPGRVERWRLHHGSTHWVALVRWGPDTLDWSWYLYDPATIRQVPEPAGPNGPADW
ncbi:hypothetical protein OG196_43985 (plasmid) [Kitasatospora purpeofusca]|uniref:hypothetical protein n=1 Tax=Kitasatospora purpeofusca TaxID=67352 RepID=UPI002E0E5CBA|nr:hypothetical protein OG196_43985 [Kitasatospora purpeofusca]